MNAKTTLYAASVQPLADPTRFRAAYEAASAARRQKTDALRGEKDKRLSLGAEMLLQYALRERNVAPDALRTTVTATGKPILAGTALRHNLSHAGDWALCAVSDVEVGCDIEKIGDRGLAIAERFFCPEEAAAIRAQPSAEAQSLLFYRFWTLKESFLKATGFGFSLPLDRFLITLDDPIRVTGTADAASCRFTEFGDIPGYRCAVCTIGDCAVGLQIVDLTSLLPEQEK